MSFFLAIYCESIYYFQSAKVILLKALLIKLILSLFSKYCLKLYCMVGTLGFHSNYWSQIETWCLGYNQFLCIVVKFI
jgi:hypothetical protein